MGMAAVLLAGSVVPAVAAPVYVLGDSIGEDVGRVAGETTLAKISVSLANRWIYRQLPVVPDGATVVLALGTNDADETNGVRHLGKHIDALVAYVNEHRLKAYWLGPVCVTTASAARAEELDRILAARLKSTSITYVSLHTPELCAPDLHARDGQHMRDVGSKRIWQDVSRVAGWPVAPEMPVVAQLEPSAVDQAAAANPASAGPRPVKYPLPPVKPALTGRKPVASKSNLPHLAPHPADEELAAPERSPTPLAAPLRPPAALPALPVDATLPAPIPPLPAGLAATPEPPSMQSMVPPPKPAQPPPLVVPHDKPPDKPKRQSCFLGIFCFDN
ncbi:MAG: SGNH/GDSL hydrolase family protein [Ancalomicrobiaceae bacterium]|nr:SGNH/GDSL hydrolase family protein [Ancalomicrobiaceae bacterium]